jgi:hypothetical protein
MDPKLVRVFTVCAVALGTTMGHPRNRTAPHRRPFDVWAITNTNHTALYATVPMGPVIEKV